jgi:hypothetical protein
MPALRRPEELAQRSRSKVTEVKIGVRRRDERGASKALRRTTEPTTESVGVRRRDAADLDVAARLLAKRSVASTRSAVAVRF